MVLARDDKPRAERKPYRAPKVRTELIAVPNLFSCTEGKTYFCAATQSCIPLGEECL